MGAAYQQSDLP